MREQSGSLREAVGVFTMASDLQAAIDELLSSGFHRAELSLLAGEEALNEQLGGFSNARALEDDPAVPRSAYVSPEAIGDAQGGIVSALAYAGATAAGGAIVLSGGAIVTAIVAATLAGGAGTIAGAMLAKWLGDHHGRYLQTQIDHGGLLLWVRTRNAKAEERALQILRTHSARDAHVHTLILEAVQIGGGGDPADSQCPFIERNRHVRRPEPKGPDLTLGIAQERLSDGATYSAMLVETT